MEEEFLLYHQGTIWNERINNISISFSFAVAIKCVKWFRENIYFHNNQRDSYKCVSSYQMAKM